MKCAVIGGTGWQGVGVAVRIAYAGHTALIGSRDIEKSKRVAERVPTAFEQPSERFIGMTNEEAAKECDIAFLTVPMDAHLSTLIEMKEHLKGKILIDVTAPVDPKNQIRNLWPPEGSATEQAANVLRNSSEVVGALKNISATALINYKKPSNCDILVIGEDISSKFRVMALLREMGLTSFDAGSGDACRTVEGMTALLIYLNYAYHLRQPGIKISQIDSGLEFIPTDDLFL